MKEKFKEDYFVKDVDSKDGSNYIDYRTKKFSVLADNIIEIFELGDNNSGKKNILDFGCATGALLKELKDRGFSDIKGTDISNWAIEYGKDAFRLESDLEFYNRNLLCEPFDYIIMLDVLEHLPDYELETVLGLAKKGLRHKLLVRIPVSLVEGEDFVLDVSKNDRTHIQIHDTQWWLNKIESVGFKYLTDIHKDAIYSSPGVFCAIFGV
jgi:predicted TPR repeat methyltransferase